DDAAGLQGAAGLGVLDDAPGRTVLDRPAGIEEFGLAENGAAGQLRRPFQLDERCVADGFDEIVAYLHDELLRLQEFAETIRPLGRRSSARSTSRHHASATPRSGNVTNSILASERVDLGRSGTSLSAN